MLNLLTGAFISILTGVILHMLNRICDRWLDDCDHKKHK